VEGGGRSAGGGSLLPYNKIYITLQNCFFLCHHSNIIFVNLEKIYIKNIIALFHMSPAVTRPPGQLLLLE